MKTTRLLLCTASSLAVSLLLSQCTGTAVPLGSQALTGGTVSVQTLGDTKITTQRLINRPLTDKDIGKVFEVITTESPRGKHVQKRVIVRAVPRLETKNIDG